MSRARSWLPLLAVMAGCTHGGGSGPESARRTPIAAHLRAYGDARFLIGTREFPVVGSFATVAGPADSTFLLFGFSMPTSGLRFERDGQSFGAAYDVVVVVRRDSFVVRRLERRETVRVPSFAETSRPDESVFFQTAIALAPGAYHVDVAVRDVTGSHAFAGTDSVVVPAYGTGARLLSDPLVVFRSEPRADRAVTPRSILNPRHTVSYGADSARMHVESYGAVPARVRVLDESGADLWARTLRLDSSALATHTYAIESDVLPLGQLALELHAGADAAALVRWPIFVTISDKWMVANFEEAFQMLAYIAKPSEIDSLREAKGAERRARWDAFWARRDPLPATRANEYRDDFFERVREASIEFSREGGGAGWQTDRGEVYITLGRPDQEWERNVGRLQHAGQPNALEWIYDRLPGGTVSLLFVDRSGFGRLELTPDSRSAFRSVASRLQRDRED